LPCSQAETFFTDDQHEVELDRTAHLRISCQHGERFSVLASCHPHGAELRRKPHRFRPPRKRPLNLIVERAYKVTATLDASVSSALEMPMAAAAYADSVQDKLFGESGKGILASL